jgi:hypothetical protein
MIRENHGRAWNIELERQLAGYVIVLFGFSLEYGGCSRLMNCLLPPNFVSMVWARPSSNLLKPKPMSLGAILLTLETEFENENAREFYGKYGFTELKRRVMHKPLSLRIRFRVLCVWHAENAQPSIGLGHRIEGVIFHTGFTSH